MADHHYIKLAVKPLLKALIDADFDHTKVDPNKILPIRTGEILHEFGILDVLRFIGEIGGLILRLLANHDQGKHFGGAPEVTTNDEPA